MRCRCSSLLTLYYVHAVANKIHFELFLCMLCELYPLEHLIATLNHEIANKNELQLVANI